MGVRVFNFEKAARTLKLTSVELRVIVFLLILFFVGIISLYLKNQAKTVVKVNFDYSVEDSLFQNAGSDSENLMEKNVDSEQELLDFRKDKISRRSNDTKVLELTSINLNTADISDFVRLPGIGEKTAERIIVFRNSIGKFSAIEGLMKVKGNW